MEYCKNQSDSILLFIFNNCNWVIVEFVFLTVYPHRIAWLKEENLRWLDMDLCLLFKDCMQFKRTSVALVKAAILRLESFTAYTCGGIVFRRQA